MKKTILVFLLVAGICKVQAQSPNNREDNSGSNAHGIIQQDNEYANTEINVENRRATFSDLPELKKCTWAIVTDATGAVITQKRITPADNTMDLYRLPKGGMYFVTLIYKNKSKKGFVLHL